MSDDAPTVGDTEAPTVPCEECAAATQRAVIVAVAVGALAGVAGFYVLHRSGLLSRGG